MNDHLTGEATLGWLPISINVIVRPDLLAAVLLDVRFARRAVPATPHKQPDPDPVPGSQAGHLRSHLQHLPYNLMATNR